ncbi:MAG TPA: TM0106 family RecB-like putative nuclease [Candidatus Polarisedimenticolaceae bacterium]
MPGPASLLAHHLYDLAICEHRVALDTRLDRSLRTPPDEAALHLFERGLALEAEVGRALGWPEITVEEGDWRGAADRTTARMRDGAPGILQGVLLGDRRLARPDLLERVEGESALGGWHYVPGDVKSAFEARTDAVLQIGFAARLLEAVQGRRPAHGFVILGDGSRETFALDDVGASIDAAIARAEAVASGKAATAPSFSAACARCRWRSTCLPELESARDASFVHGLTRAMRSALARHGVATVDDLAACDPGALRRAGAPPDGLERLQRQAQALLRGAASGTRPVRIPDGAAPDRFLRIEVDPLEGREPFLFAWGTADRADAAVALDDPARLRAFARLAHDLEGSPAAPVFTFGVETARALGRLADRAAWPPARIGDLEGRVVNLAPLVRRRAALPVFHYRFDEVAAFVERRPRPALDAPEDALFVTLAAERERAVPALEEAGRRSVASLVAIRRWLGGAS